MMMISRIKIAVVGSYHLLSGFNLYGRVRVMSRVLIKKWLLYSFIQ